MHGEARHAWDMDDPSCTELEPYDLDTGEVGRLLNKSQGWVSRQAYSGAIPAVRVGGTWRFSAPELARWLVGQQGTR